MASFLAIMQFACKKEGCTDPMALNYNEDAKKDDNSCIYENSEEMDEPKSFTLTIENIQTNYQFKSSGVFNTPVGSTSPGPAMPGNSYTFTVHAGPGDKLSFATMFVGSNDLIYAPEGEGVDLFDGNNPVHDDITSQIYLWDAGTEMNEEPGAGPNQPMNQSGPNTGPTENGTVRKISNVSDGFTYPSVASTIEVTLAAGSNINEFVVTIKNLSSSSTPLAPGVWVIHNSSNPLFTENQPDYMQGLEAIAEDGDPTMLDNYLRSNSGQTSPIAPGLWAVHTSGSPLYENGDIASAGLEALAEDGDPSVLNDELVNTSSVQSKGIFNIPAGASSPGVVVSGNKYEITFTASKGDYLSFATMFVQSNDLFYGVDPMGIALWDGDNPRSGDITSSVDLWDAGTEVNQLPAVGLDQAPRQSGPDTGADENGVVQIVNDGNEYLPTTSSVKVSLQVN